MATTIVIDDVPDHDLKAQQSFVHFDIYEGPEDAIQSAFDLRSGDSIGRKNTNIVQFADDLHMSNLHCKVNLVQDKFFFEDIASTNGSWLRMSLEANESDSFPLKEQMVFKIGNSA
jgi:predicted component of type VI protein secretion system